MGRLSVFTSTGNINLCNQNVTDEAQIRGDLRFVISQKVDGME